METIEKSIEVNCPVRSVYDQWTQFESFPLFMEGIKAVRQLDDRHLEWHAEIAGRGKAWEAEIIEQEPDQRIAWRSTSGSTNNGVVSFEAVDPEHTRVTLTMNYEPEGTAEKIGDALGVVSLRVAGDLKRFKQCIEKRTTPPQGWRGEVADGQVNPPVV